uniref:VPRBP protein n=1 Tax=Pan troglodytes TaxID=9598 RepID=G2HH71_PANTR|nr:VPRBP protein [Pan troglodytes]
MKHSFTEDHYVEFSKHSQDRVIGTKGDIAHILPTTTRGTVPPSAPTAHPQPRPPQGPLALPGPSYAGCMKWAGSVWQRMRMKRRTRKRKNRRKKMMMKMMMTPMI